MKTPPELNSLPSEDKRPRRSQMAMNSDLTREQFKAREIEQAPPEFEETLKENAKEMDTVREQFRAMTVDGRKKQRNRLRKKLGIDDAAPLKRVRQGTPVPRARPDEYVEDKLYAVGKPPVDEAQ